MPLAVPSRLLIICTILGIFGREEKQIDVIIFIGDGVELEQARLVLNVLPIQKPVFIAKAHFQESRSTDTPSPKCLHVYNICHNQGPTSFLLLFAYAAAFLLIRNVEGKMRFVSPFLEKNYFGLKQSMG